jgi:protein phosphatase
MSSEQFDQKRGATGTHDWRQAVSGPLNLDTFSPLSAEFELEVAAASKCGVHQRINTDHYLAIRLGRMQETVVTSLAQADLPAPFEEYGYAMLVADGLGSRDTGARASRLALSALAHLAIRYGRWNVRVWPDMTDDIREQGEFLYRRIHDVMMNERRADFRLADMATSLTAVYIAGADLFYAHVGHSRAFLFSNGTLTQLTTDHTLVQPRRDAPATAAPNHAQYDAGHLVTEAIGGRPGGPAISFEHARLWSGDRVLLCTNGLTDVLSASEIADILSMQRRPQEDCQRLTDCALAANSEDSVTVLLADYRCASRPSEADAGNS